MDTLQMPAGVPFPEYFELFMDWKTPLVIATAYAILVHHYNPKVGKVSRVVAKSAHAKSSEKSQSGSAMTAFVFVHNLVLCIYSGMTFYKMLPAVINNYRTHNLFDAYCDLDGSLWDNALGYWGYIFYLSKFYEVIDTAIIIIKGRRSSLLQTYHHSGAMITMWSGIRYRSAPIWVFVTFNSCVHTIMYCYYALTCVGIHPPGKKYLTTIQITQFLTGTFLAFVYAMLPGCVTSRGAQMAIWITLGYIFPLIYLFVDFAKRTYSKRGALKVQMKDQ
ncbi:hypothetical protein BGZ76_005173 [Entomortierella beljakovae]|nr:hypothetical protein BGZ76_005173 [Entomortierella beljakovae]